MKNFSVILICLMALSSCKKDKLTGEKEILVGKWKWVYSEHTYSLCNPPSVQEVLTPATTGKIADLEFYSNGKVSFNGENKDRIVFYYWVKPNYNLTKNEFEFHIKLNNNDEFNFGGGVSADTLVLTGDYIEEPFEDVSCNGCCTYTNYFVRE